MKFLPEKKIIPWLLILIAVVAAIVIYRFGFHTPVRGFNEEALKSLTETKLDKAEPVFQTSYAVELMREPPEEPRYGSEKPLYFCVVFGKEGKNPMLCVVDESAGTGTGYDVAYLDENMNGNLTDDGTKKFSRYESGSREGELQPRFEFEGPFKGEEKAGYTLDIYSLAPRYRKNLQEDEYYFFWSLEIKDWNYFFINGKINMFSSLADALKGTPVILGGECKWDIKSRIQDNQSFVSAGLKDRNGCTLRIVGNPGQTVSPTLKLIKNGKVETEKKMKFG
ncbi:MAG: hypothetical protein JW715_03705 [Sedimentisphaerales bacterium]|nr:hypothetical protein [Sedimentisphaerales bacterium]